MFKENKMSLIKSLIVKVANYYMLLNCARWRHYVLQK